MITNEQHKWANYNTWVGWIWPPGQPISRCSFTASRKEMENWPYLLLSVCPSNYIYLPIGPPSFKRACPSGLGFVSPEPKDGLGHLSPLALGRLARDGQRFHPRAFADRWLCAECWAGAVGRGFSGASDRVQEKTHTHKKLNRLSL